MNILNEIPKYRKKSQKKRFKIVWTRIDKSKSNFNQFDFNEFTQNYATKKAAEQALNAWKTSKLNNSYALFCPKRWIAEIIDN
jgi:GTPase involved in cell partitioning and DNA repair